MRLANARALMEFQMPTYARVAACMGINVTTLQKYAAVEEWVVADHRRHDVSAAFEALRRKLAGRALPADAESLDAGATEAPEAAEDAAMELDTLSPDERLMRLGELLSRQAARILAAAEASRGVLKKDQIEALSALIRLAERFETLATERAAEKQTRSDDEIAGLLNRIDERIVELAVGHAARLGRGEPSG